MGQLQREHGLPIPVDDYVEQFHFGLMEVVFEWARGMVGQNVTEGVININYTINATTDEIMMLTLAQ